MLMKLTMATKSGISNGNLLFAVLLLLLLIGLASASTLSNPPAIVSVTPLPYFTTNANGIGRDSGKSGKIGSSVLWMFGDTFCPGVLRSSTAGWSHDLQSPWNLFEETEYGAFPYQFYPFTDEELAFNNAHNGTNIASCCKNLTRCDLNAPPYYCNCPNGTDCAQRVAHWPGNLYAVNDTHGINFYSSLVIGWYGWDYRPIGQGIAYVTFNKTTTSRVMSPSNSSKALYLFDGKYAGGITMNGLRVNDTFYFYSADNISWCTVNAYLSRVTLANVLNASAYEHWTGSGWGSDVSKIGALGEFRFADTPEGPWSTTISTKYNFTIVNATTGSYASELHSHFQYGNSLIATFYTPNASNVFNGKLRMYNITFETLPSPTPSPSLSASASPSPSSTSSTSSASSPSFSFSGLVISLASLLILIGEPFQTFSS